MRLEAQINESCVHNLHQNWPTSPVELTITCIPSYRTCLPSEKQRDDDFHKSRHHMCFMQPRCVAGQQSPMASQFLYTPPISTVGHCPENFMFSVELPSTRDGSIREFQSAHVLGNPRFGERWTLTEVRYFDYVTMGRFRPPGAANW